jgi:hypothetical protein
LSIVSPFVLLIALSLSFSSLFLLHPLPVPLIFSHTGRVYIFLTVFTIANVYIVNQINSVILHPEIFSKVFNIPLEKAVSWLSTASGLTQSLLFSICPYLFLMLANIEGSATSLDKAEQKALIYFWYFFIIARFMGQIIWDITVNFLEGCEYGLFWVREIVPSDALRTA